MKRWSEEEDDIILRAREASESLSNIESLLPLRSKGAIATRFNYLKNKGRPVKHGNSKWSDELLLKAVIKYRTAEALNNYRTKDEPWATTVARRFNGWTNALIAAGLKPNDSCLSPHKITTLYLVYFQDCDLYKVGLTQKDVKLRFNKRSTVKLLDSIDFDDLQEARDFEKELLGIIKPFRAKEYPDYLYKDGHTECFSVEKLESLEAIYNL